MDYSLGGKTKNSDFFGGYEHLEHAIFGKEPGKSLSVLAVIGVRVLRDRL